MIDLGFVTPSGSISIPFVLYMAGTGGGGEGGWLCNLFTGPTCTVSMTFKEYVNPIWTGLFPNLRRLNEWVQKDIPS